MAHQRLDASHPFIAIYTLYYLHKFCTKKNFNRNVSVLGTNLEEQYIRHGEGKVEYTK